MALISPFAPLLFVPFPPLLLIAFLAAPALWVWLLPVAVVLLIGLLIFRRQFRIRPQRFPRPKAGTTFTIMTFNIWWSSQQRSTARVPLENDLPDIVLFQELTPNMARYIDEELGQHYSHRLFSTGEHPQSSRLGAISCYPLESLETNHLAAVDFRIQILRVTLPTRRTPSSDTPSGSMAGSIIDSTADTVLVYNIHPRATNVLRFWQEGGSFVQKVNRSFSERIYFFKRLIADIEARSEPVIIAGDFNSTPLSDVYGLICNHFTDTHVANGRGLGHTFPAHTNDLNRLPIPQRIMRLDMIFCAKDLAVIDNKVGFAHGESDHMPVIATIRIPQNRIAI